jgi:hypothetical protein
MKRFSEDYGKNIVSLGLVFVMVKNTKLMRDTMDSLRGNPKLRCFDNTLSDSTRIAETRPDKTILDLKGNDRRYAKEMENIVDEFISRVGHHD